MRVCTLFSCNGVCMSDPWQDGKYVHCKYLPLSPYKALEKFSKALYGTKGGTYSARIFRPVMFSRQNKTRMRFSDIKWKTVPSINSIVTKLLFLLMYYNLKWQNKQVNKDKQWTSNNATKQESTVEKTRKSDNVVVQESVVGHCRAPQ